MTENFHARSAFHCTSFFAAHLLLALLLITTAPANFEDISKPVAWWGQLLQSVLPSIEGISRASSFHARAWLTLVALWTVMPFSVWWAARGGWVVAPDLNGRPRRPWLVFVFAALFIALAVFMAVYEPVIPASTRQGRAFARALNSPVQFGIQMAVVFSGLAIAFGALPSMFRAHRSPPDDAL